MKRINRIFAQLASAAPKSAPLAISFACLALGSGNLAAAQKCSGGTYITDSANHWVGCMFSSWGTAEQQMCNGFTVLAKNNNCHVCLAPPYDAQAAVGNFSALTTSPPTSFDVCLQCGNIPAGLTAWWPLEETNGAVHDRTGLVAVDGSRLGGASTVPGEVGSATHFSGANQYISIPNDAQLDVGKAAADGSGDFSIDAWVKVDAPADLTGVRVVAEKRTQTFTNGSAHYKGYSFFLYNGQLAVQLADDGIAPGYGNYISTLKVLADPTNYHFVAVSVTRGGKAEFTLDNLRQIFTPIGQTGSLANPSPLNFGMRTIDTGGAFKGSIDEVEFFHRAVPFTEWQQIFTAGCKGKCNVPPTPYNGGCYGVDSSTGNWSWYGSWDSITQSCRNIIQ